MKSLFLALNLLCAASCLALNDSAKDIGASNPHGPKAKTSTAKPFRQPWLKATVGIAVGLTFASLA
jgi:hypothetical protein